MKLPLWINFNVLSKDCPPIKPLPDDVCEKAQFSACSSDSECLVGQYCCTGPCGTPTCLSTLQLLIYIAFFNRN